MMAFQTDIANCLLNSNKPQKRGRPSSENSQIVKKKAANGLSLPVSTVRYDEINHWPQQMNIPNTTLLQRGMHIKKPCPLLEVQHFSSTCSE